MIQLTDEEIQGVLDAQDSDHYCDCVDIAKAQLKKVVEWGDRDCPHIANVLGKKHYCFYCWQALSEEVQDT